MHLSVTPLYAAVLTFLFVGLAWRVTRCRRAARVALGNGGDARLERAIRAHANCAEYVPLGLLLLMAAELAGASHGMLHVAGIVLVFGRFVHAYGISQPNEDLRFRTLGMASTFGVLAGLAVLLLVTYWG